MQSVISPNAQANKLHSDGLQLSAQQLQLLQSSVIDFVRNFEAQLEQTTASYPTAEASQIAQWLQPPPEHGLTHASNSVENVFATLQAAAKTGVETAAGSHLSYVPNGGIQSASLGRYIAAALNRYTGIQGLCPGAVALEHSLVNWMCALFGLGKSATGLFLSGGSMANFMATVTARNQLGEDFSSATVYVSASTHLSVEKACRLAGINTKNVRVTPLNNKLQMDVAALNAQIKSDIAAGFKPMMIVATAGTTDASVVDDLGSCAALARRYKCWLHVDAAYGGFFALTKRGQIILQEISKADSITVDAHKSLFLPYGIGTFLVSDRNKLLSKDSTGAYLQDSIELTDLPDYGSMGPELTRPGRGLELWFALQYHGVATFRSELDRMLDYAEYAANQLSQIPEIKLVTRPVLSIVCFRAHSGDAATQHLLDFINAQGKLHISSTRVRNKLTLRAAFLNPRTRSEHVDQLILSIRQAFTCPKIANTS